MSIFISMTSAGPMATQLSPCMYEQVSGFGRLALSDFGTLGRRRVRLLRRVHEIGLADLGKSTGQGTARPGLAVANRRMLPTWREYAAAHTSLQDSLAHFIGRLAFCRSADLRAWFVDGEVALLMWRVRNTLTPDERAAWVLAFCTSALPLGDDEFAQMGPALREATDTVFCGGIMGRSFCKVPFEQVPKALARRRVLMRDGWAYVCVDDAVDAAVCAFRKRVDRALALLAPNWPDFARAEHDRLFPLVVGLSAQYVRFLALATLICLSCAHSLG